MPLLVSHKNNFDLLRFVFAFIVFLVHTYVLSGRQELAALARWLSSEFAVKSFFVVSGYLVFMSFENSKSLGDYFSKRARRIYPAYFTVIVCAALAGAVFSALPLNEYLSAELLRYLAANLTFLNFLAPELPGVFQTNTFHAVNGALWTLKIEVLFYLSVPVITAISIQLGRIRVFAAIYALSVAYVLVLDHLAASTNRELFLQLARQLPGQLSYFIAGAVCYYYLAFLKRWWMALAAIALALLVVPLPRLVETVVEPAALGILVVYLAVGARYVGNFGRYGDLSYGVYIIHFPVLQTLIALGVFQGNPYLAVALAAALVLAAAFVSWHLVEKPFLKKSSHYVVATAATKIA
jgi:peptidoglycan/LPS O-acetylase OafA/YrhL